MNTKRSRRLLILVLSAALLVTALPLAAAASVPAEVELNYPLLGNGSEGPKVKALQGALGELGFYPGLLDSKFGPGTQKAVIAFQKMNAITQTGIADPLTQQRLFEGKPKNADGKAMEVKTLPSMPGLVLRPGNLGDAILELQRRLKELGFYKGSVDGDYGRGTQDAVTAFQREKGLKADGIAGSATQALLFPNSVSQTEAAPSPEPTISPVFSANSTEAEATYPYRTTASASINMRKSASLSAMRLVTVPSGAAIEVLSTSGDFLKVKYRDYTGYVLGLYVEIPEQYLEGRALPVSITARQNYETLAVGATGAKVRTLQQALTELGYYQGSIDANFGPGTLASLKEFQVKNKLRPTGIALPELQELLYEKRPRNVRGNLVNLAVLPPVSGYTMQQGDKGDAVLELQKTLEFLGLYKGPLSDTYTADTSAAVRAFQKDHSIRVTGKTDSFTLLAINTLRDKNLQSATPVQLVTAAPPSDIIVTPSQQATLSIGSAGEAVIALQSRLISLRYLKGEADGAFGTQTALAVTAFQKNSGLSADGLAGAVTLGALYSAAAKPNDFVTADASPQPGSDGFKSLRIGDSGSEVKAMQQKLISLKYLTGGADGIFGPKSFLALQSFQSNNKLTSDGIAGRLTLAKLSDPKAIAASGLSVNLPTPTPTAAPAVTEAPEQNVFTAPRASEVRRADWYGEIRSRIRSMPNVTIFDFMSGAHYSVKVFSVGKHADGEPPTKQDTGIMEKALGYNNWTPRPVWVIFSDGRVYMASTHSHGHEVDHNSGNGLTGHICIHFPRDMADAIATGDYAVLHQNAILAGWDLTQSMIR